MKTIGLDIGTTTICIVLLDADSGILLQKETVPNTAHLSSEHRWEKLQNPTIILAICKQLLDALLVEHKDIASIGITGQMHGILYVNENGTAASPLYTWQDGRGNLPFQEHLSYVDYLTAETNHHMATGFGLATHFYHVVNHSFPMDNLTFCTIPDFIAMSIAQQTKPLLHQSMAASLGCFDLMTKQFDTAALINVGIPVETLPPIAPLECLSGHTPQGIPVSIAIGDNQASFLGSVNAESNLLVNVGTGSQISLCCSEYLPNTAGECRPYIADTYLVAGSPLCGGYSYSLLKQFFEETLTLFGCNSNVSIYEQMNQAATDIYHAQHKLCIDTRLNGTRTDSTVAGSITNLTTDTFHPAHFILGVLDGICKELYDFYKDFPKDASKSFTFIGSGNGIRVNPLLQRIFSDTFHMTLRIPSYSEEAAYGSALFSLLNVHYYNTLQEVQHLIQYKS